MIIDQSPWPIKNRKRKSMDLSLTPCVNSPEVFGRCHYKAPTRGSHVSLLSPKERENASPSILLLRPRRGFVDANLAVEDSQWDEIEQRCRQQRLNELGSSISDRERSSCGNVSKARFTHRVRLLMIIAAAKFQR